MSTRTRSTTLKADAFAVVQHSSGPQGGYVVRSVWGNYLPAPYAMSDAIRVYKREGDAQRPTDRLQRAAEVKLNG